MAVNQMCTQNVKMTFGEIAEWCCSCWCWDCCRSLYILIVWKQNSLGAVSECPLKQTKHMIINPCGCTNAAMPDRAQCLRVKSTEKEKTMESIILLSSCECYLRIWRGLNLFVWTIWSASIHNAGALVATTSFLIIVVVHVLCKVMLY